MRVPYVLQPRAEAAQNVDAKESVERVALATQRLLAAGAATRRDTDTVHVALAKFHIVDLLATLVPMAVGFVLASLYKEPSFLCDLQLGSCSQAGIEALLDVRAQRCPERPSEDGHATALVVQHAPQCKTSERRAWTGECHLEFGIEQRLLGTSDVCQSVYNHACERYSERDREAYGVPRAFVSNARANAALLSKLQLVEAVRVWSQDPWARIVGTCDDAIRNPRASAEDDAWFASELRRLRDLALEDPAAALARAQRMGAAVFLHSALARLPTNRSSAVMYLEAQPAPEPPLTARYTADAALLPAREVWDQVTAKTRREAQQFWRALVEFFHLGRASTATYPSTLYGYVLRSTFPSLQQDYTAHEATPPGALHRWVQAIRREHGGAFSQTVGVWAFARQDILSLIEFVEANRRLLGSYLVCAVMDGAVVWDAAAQAEILDSARATRLLQDSVRARAVRHKFASSPPHSRLRAVRSVDLSEAQGLARGGAWRPECAAFATAKVWWRVDRWYREATQQKRLRQPLRAVFENVRDAMVALVEMQFAGGPDGALGEFLARKLRRVRLRFVGSTPARYDADGSLPETASSFLRELQGVNNATLTRFSPFVGERGRVLDAIDLPSFTANAFYCATDNTLALFPGLLNGAFYSLDAPVEDLFATVGALIGHELAHAIDTRGIWYGYDGSVGEHAPREQVARYLANFGCVADAFSAENINGERVLDESFADAVGLQAARFAYERYTHANNVTSAPGATRNFFIQYAQLWCGQLQQETSHAWERRYGADVHAPPRARVDFAAATAGAAAAFECSAETAGHSCAPLG